MATIALINGTSLTIREDGLVNISDMFKASKTSKRPYDWERNIGSQKFIQAVAEREKKQYDEVYSKQSRGNIWAHQFIALKIAGWISTEFDVLMMDIVLRYQKGDKNLITEILDIGDERDGTITNMISVAPADSSQIRHTIAHSIAIAQMTTNQKEKQRKFNERMPNMSELFKLPTNDNGEIDTELLDDYSSENVILEIIGCSRKGLETYADIVDATKGQLVLLHNEIKKLNIEIDELKNDKKIEHLYSIISHLVRKINNISIPSEIENDDIKIFLDNARDGIYRPLSDDYRDHLQFLRSALMDINISQNCVEKQQLAIVISVLKNILAPKLTEQNRFSQMPSALIETSAHPSYFSQNVATFEDEDGNIATYDTFEIMGLDKPEILKRVSNFPCDWKNAIISKLNKSIVRTQFDRTKTHIRIYVGYDAIFPTKKDLFIEFTTEMLSISGLTHMEYVGESHLNKSAGEFVDAVCGGHTIIPYVQSIDKLIEPHAIVSVIGTTLLKLYV